MTTPSFRRIDYSLRPAKHAERRMLCDIFRRLRPFGLIEDYVYVGFGSVWFADFALLHRSLGVRDMISFEQADSARDRIEANKPFRISVDYRRSTEALPDLDWTRNHFLWLDYDDPLSTSMLLDIQAVCGRARSGTALAVSVQCSRAPEDAAAEHERRDNPSSPTGLEKFINTFGPDRVGPDVAPDDLLGWRFASLSRKLLMQEIATALAVRNLNTERKMNFHLVCEIEYEDGAKMTTIVGVFYEDGDKSRIEQCHFSGLDFVPNPLAPIRINVPKLTAREFKFLESQMPLDPDSELQLGAIPNAEAARFRRMYRYLPSFAVLEG